MFCMQCGNQNQDGSKFCSQCGYKITSFVEPGEKTDSNNVRSRSDNNEKLSETSLNQVSPRIIAISIVAIVLIIQVIWYANYKSDCINYLSPVCQDVKQKAYQIFVFAFIGSIIIGSVTILALPNKKR